MAMLTGDPQPADVVEHEPRLARHSTNEAPIARMTDMTGPCYGLRMVNRGALFISFTVATLVTSACSDDDSWQPSDRADAAPSGATLDAGLTAVETLATTRPDADAPDATLTSPNGQSSTDVAATASDVNDSSTDAPASDPATTTSSLPLFTSSEPMETNADGTSSSTPEPVTPGSVVFAADQVLDVYITVSPEDLVSLNEHGNAELYLPGEVTISGAGFDTYSASGVGVRHKGAYTLHHCWVDDVRVYENECAKLSLKLKFDEFAKGQRFDGLKRLNLHASSGDGTKLRELLAYTTFAEFGVDAPRLSVARVTVNGELRGLFFAVEELDGRYAAAHFPDGPDGNLFKEVWPVKAQTDEAYIDALETNDEHPDVSDIRAFAEAIDATTEETFEADMAPWVDIDNIVRYLVVDRAIKNWDGIMAFYEPLRPHNFFWYHDSGPNGRFHLIPWDLDNTFWPIDPYMAPQEWFLNVAPVPDWNVAPLNCDPRPVWDVSSDTYITPPRCDKFLDLLAKTQWARFVELGLEFKAQVLESPHFTARLDHWETMLASLVSEDPTLTLVGVATEQAYFRAIIDDIIYDFGEYLGRGLQEETVDSGPELLPEPTEDDLLATTPPRGIEPWRVTNFEFDFALEPHDADAGAAGSDPVSSALDASVSDDSGPTVALPSIDDAGAPPGAVSRELPYADVAASPGSTAIATWNTEAPLWGQADARLDFVHHRTPGAFSEWVNLFLYMNDGVVDATGYTQIEMTLRTDKFRSVRVRIGGTVSADFGGVWDEFGADFFVDSSPTHVVLPLHELVYPIWAKAAWEDGQGWTFPDAIARELFLATMWGLIFVPGPTLDPDGELIDESDPGFLQVDNIYFR